MEMQINVIAEHTEPGRPERRLRAPDWVLQGPTAPLIQPFAPDDMLYRHQSLALDQLHQDTNLVISTGTASGKSLIFQVATMHRLKVNPYSRAIAIYPLKALSRDQMTRWQAMARQVGISPNQIVKIDGDVRPQDRQPLLANARLALMTPDIIHHWLLKYADPQQRNARPWINELRDTIRQFMVNLQVLIIDEAHIYEGAFGANMAYIIRRVRAKVTELNHQTVEPLVIAASATIDRPTDHLNKLTGLQFEEVTEQDNGSPKSPLLLRHVAGRDYGPGSEDDMADLIDQILRADPDDTYIAFADDRQKVERISAKLDPTHMLVEEDIIRTSNRSMPYRAGLQHRDLIEERLKSGEIRGVVSTSALEMGIDIPELTVGINLGIPHSIKRLRQRAGRVGRTRPGTFYIMSDEYAFQFDQESLKGYWSRDIEPARLYLTNDFIQRFQTECLMVELDQKTDLPDLNWPEGFQAIAESRMTGDPYDPDLATSKDQPAFNQNRPHDHDIRSTSDKTFGVYVEGLPNTLTTVTKIEAMKELYTWATYRHAKQAYRVLHWHEQGSPERGDPHIILTTTGSKPRTSRILETSAEVHIDDRESVRSETGALHYLTSKQAYGIETIIGCRAEQNNRNTEFIYAETPNTPNISRETPTTATLLKIDQDWFRTTENREILATALVSIMCHLDNINDSDVMAAFERITTVEKGVIHNDDPAIVIWDRFYGGLGLSRTMFDKVRQYADRLLEIAEDPTRHPGSMPLPLVIARPFKEWADTLNPPAQPPEPAASTPPHPTPPATPAPTPPADPEPTQANPPEAQPRLQPRITRYHGVTFRSQLEARWAAHFDREQLPWSYEPDSFGNWIPDFRIGAPDRPAYAEVKPTTQFPRNVADKIDQSQWKGTAFILGLNQYYVWYRGPDGWTQANDQAIRATD